MRWDMLPVCRSFHTLLVYSFGMTERAGTLACLKTNLNLTASKSHPGNSWDEAFHREKWRLGLLCACDCALSLSPSSAGEAFRRRCFPWPRTKRGNHLYAVLFVFSVFMVTIILSLPRGFCRSLLERMLIFFLTGSCTIPTQPRNMFTTIVIDAFAAEGDPEKFSRAYQASSS